MKSNQLNHSNGLMVEGDTMYIASWGELQGEGDDAVSNGWLLRPGMNSHEITPVAKGPIGNIDGIQRYGGGFLISEWRGDKIYEVTQDGLQHEITAPGQSVGDFPYMPERKQLFLPINRQAKLLIYSLPCDS